MPNDFSLHHRIAVITGGCGFLGQRFAKAIVNYGGSVAVIDTAPHPKEPLPEWTQAVKEERIKVFQGDVTCRPELEQALKEITTCWGTPHILVNNAAIDSPPNAPLSENGPFETYPEASLDKALGVNLKGTFLVSQVFGGAMAKEQRGSIINVASIYGLLSPVQDLYEYQRQEGRDWYKPATYASTKAAVLNLTRYLATYWASRGIRVNSLTPGGVFHGQDDRFVREYSKRVPLGRMARPEELLGALIFLASDASSYVTGSNLIVDGGWTAW